MTSLGINAVLRASMMIAFPVAVGCWLRVINSHCSHGLVKTFLRTAPTKPTNAVTTPFFWCDNTILRLRRQTLETRCVHNFGIDIATEEPTMRKLVFSMGAIAIAFMVAIAWSHTVLAPSQASTATSINPTDMMTNYKGSLPIEQWEAI